MANFKLALSAGHGKYTAGKRCLKKLDPGETREWVLNSRIADMVEKMLLEYEGIEILRLDDTTGVKDVSIYTRTDDANKWGADFYLAIHHNAGIKGGKGGGIVAYIARKASTQSAIWQEELYEALVDATNLAGNRSTPLAKADFVEVKRSSMPAVLLELGFMDSSTDVPIILSEQFAKKCADAIVEVIVKRAKLTKRATTNNVQATKIAAALEYHRNLRGAYKVTAASALNMRAGASTKYPVVRVLKRGEQVRCYGYHTGEWLYVVTEDGTTGHCHGGYLTKK